MKLIVLNSFILCLLIQRVVQSETTDSINYCNLENELCENHIACDKDYPFVLPQFNSSKLTLLSFSEDEKIKYVRIINKLKDDLELRRIGSWGNSRIQTLSWSDELENISKVINQKLGYNSNEPYNLCFNTNHHQSTTAVFDKNLSVRTAINDMERTFEVLRSRNGFNDDLRYFFGQIGSVGCTTLQNSDERLIGTRCVYSFNF